MFNMKPEPYQSTAGIKISAFAYNFFWYESPFLSFLSISFFLFVFIALLHFAVLRVFKIKIKPIYHSTVFNSTPKCSSKFKQTKIFSDFVQWCYSLHNWTPFAQFSKTVNVLVKCGRTVFNPNILLHWKSYCHKLQLNNYILDRRMLYLISISNAHKISITQHIVKWYLQAKVYLWYYSLWRTFVLPSRKVCGFF